MTVPLTASNKQKAGANLHWPLKALRNAAIPAWEISRMPLWGKMRSLMLDETSRMQIYSVLHADVRSRRFQAELAGNNRGAGCVYPVTREPFC